MLLLLLLLCYIIIIIIIIIKLFGRVLIKRVRAGTECEISEEQCGFRQGRGCMDQVVVEIVVVVGQTVGTISSKTLACDWLCTLELYTALMIATS